MFRGIAALTVVLDHYTAHYRRYFGGADALPVAFPFSQYGVELFFMISGFVILMTLEHSKTAKDFAFSRFSRLFPAYWATVILTTFISTVLWQPRYPFWARGFVVNMTMIQEYVGIPNADDAFWTLAVELGFYAVMLAIFVVGGLRRIELIALGWLGLMVGAFTFSRVTGAELPQQANLILVLHWANLFIAGMMFYRWYRGVAGARTAVILAGCLAIEVVLRGVTSALFVAGFFGLFALAVGGRVRWLCQKPLLWLGAISYSLYLIHLNTGYYVLNTLQATGLSPFQTVLGGLLIIFALSSIFTYGIERPSLKALRQWYARRVSARASTVSAVSPPHQARITPEAS